jgi:hypothetical protein
MPDGRLYSTQHFTQPVAAGGPRALPATRSGPARRRSRRRRTARGARGGGRAERERKSGCEGNRTSVASLVNRYQGVPAPCGPHDGSALVYWDSGNLAPRWQLPAGDHRRRLARRPPLGARQRRATRGRRAPRLDLLRPRTPRPRGCSASRTGSGARPPNCEPEVAPVIGTFATDRRGNALGHSASPPPDGTTSSGLQADCRIPAAGPRSPDGPRQA